MSRFRTGGWGTWSQPKQRRPGGCPPAGGCARVPLRRRLCAYPAQAQAAVGRHPLPKTGGQRVVPPAQAAVRCPARRGGCAGVRSAEAAVRCVRLRRGGWRARSPAPAQAAVCPACKQAAGQFRPPQRRGCAGVPPPHRRLRVCPALQRRPTRVPSRHLLTVASMFSDDTVMLL